MRFQLVLSYFGVVSLLTACSSSPPVSYVEATTKSQAELMAGFMDQCTANADWKRTPYSSREIALSCAEGKIQLAYTFDKNMESAKRLDDFQESYRQQAQKEEADERAAFEASPMARALRLGTAAMQTYSNQAQTRNGTPAPFILAAPAPAPSSGSASAPVASSTRIITEPPAASPSTGTDDRTEYLRRQNISHDTDVDQKCVEYKNHKLYNHCAWDLEVVWCVANPVKSNAALSSSDAFDCRGGKGGAMWPIAANSSFVLTMEGGVYTFACRKPRMPTNTRWTPQGYTGFCE